jgi:hypothetical protein
MNVYGGGAVTNTAMTLSNVAANNNNAGGGA